MARSATYIVEEGTQSVTSFKAKLDFAFLSKQNLFCVIFQSKA
ncbi:MAG: hypothetical protein RR073_06070 [Clostridia bacterium]